VNSRSLNTVSYNTGCWEKYCTYIINEKLVTLMVNNEPWLTFMCTPIDLEALAIGFLLNEEIIQKMEDVASVRVCIGDDNIDVWLYRSVSKPDKWIRT
jgi:FdhD protein